MEDLLGWLHMSKSENSLAIRPTPWCFHIYTDKTDICGQSERLATFS